MNSRALFGGIALAVVFLGLVLVNVEFTMDDSFIAYRYSDHLARGLGLVWNPGEDPVEGYTSFLWVVLNALAIGAGIDPVVFSKIFGTLCALAAIALLARRASGLPWTLASVFVGILAFNPFFAFLTLQGLETPLAALLLLAASWLGLRLVREPTVRTMVGWYACALLAALTRPDTVPFTGGLFLGLVAVFAVRREGRRLARFLSIGAGFAVIGGAYFAWRVSYFGHVFPNPFYIKMGADGAVPGSRRADVLEYLGSFFTRLLLPYLLGFAFLLSRGAARRERLAEALPVFGACALFGAYLFTITPIQGYFWRFVFPAVPSLFLAALHLVADWRPSRGRVATISMAVTAAFFAFWNLRLLPETFHEKELRSTDNRIQAGRALAGLDATMFTSASGALPYYSRWRSVDKLGLNSEEIAHHGLTVETLEAIDPDLIIVKSNPQGIYKGGMLKHLTVHRYMIRHRGFVAIAAVHRSFGFHLYYFARRDSPLYDEIAHRLLSMEGAEYGDLNELMQEKRIPIHGAGGTRR